MTFDTRFGALSSLILALALAQALRGLSEIVTSRNRYWPHTLWLVNMVFVIVQSWWADWDYNTVEEWRFTTYLLALSAPTLAFAGVYLLVPATRSASIDWRDHFYKVKDWYFGFSIMYVLVATVVTVQVFGTPWIHPYRLVQGLLIVIFAAGIIARNETAHRVLPLVFFAVLTMSQLLLRMRIGALMAN